jgi:hypothetical protein
MITSRNGGRRALSPIVKNLIVESGFGSRKAVDAKPLTEAVAGLEATVESLSRYKGSDAAEVMEDLRKAKAKLDALAKGK